MPVVGPEKSRTGFWPGAKLLYAAIRVDVASAFIKASELLSRQTINKQINP